jgi:predicted SnoaL-like aldol condensation-catalyzing enzyme
VTTLRLRSFGRHDIQHSVHIAPGREGLFNLIKSLPPALKSEPGTIVAEGDFVIMHGRFSDFGLPVNWIVADIVRIKDDVLVEHWDVIEDEATQEQSKSGLPMFRRHLCRSSMRRRKLKGEVMTRDRIQHALDTIYEKVFNLYLAESNAQTRHEWIAALDKIESLNPRAVIAEHQRPGNDDSPKIIEETRQYIRDFDRLAGPTKTARELYDKMLELYPARVNPLPLWLSAHAAKP